MKKEKIYEILRKDVEKQINNTDISQDYFIFCQQVTTAILLAVSNFLGK